MLSFTHFCDSFAWLPLFDDFLFFILFAFLFLVVIIYPLHAISQIFVNHVFLLVSFNEFRALQSTCKDLFNIAKRFML